MTTPLMEVGAERYHSKASERYLEVRFHYPDEGNKTWEGAVPIEYRRTGTFAETPEQIREVIQAAYEAMRPSKREAWLKEQQEFWKTRPGATTTRPFFEALKDSSWKCQVCDLPPNPNWARRIQDIKEMGYTIATEFRNCPKKGRKTTHLVLLRLQRGGETGYEMWTAEVRSRILKALGDLDAYENVKRSSGLLPDHKFPEIRWDEETPDDDLSKLSESQIRDKFQLLSNQRNQAKREACRTCFQTGKRGTPFGVEYFYEGSGEWGASIPRTGLKAEAGCVGCGWYDLAKWREKLNSHLRAIGKR